MTEHEKDAEAKQNGTVDDAMHISRHCSDDPDRWSPLDCDKAIEVCRAYLLLTDEAWKLRAENARFRELLTEVAGCGVSFTDPRLSYCEVQLWRGFKEEIESALNGSA